MLDEIRKLERKAYLKFLIGIIVGILPLIFFWRTKGTFASILIPGGILLIIICLFGLTATFDMFYRIKGRIREQETGEEFKETYIEWPAWVKKWGGVLYLIIITFGIGLFAEQHENDFGGTKFVWHSVIAGIVIGLIIFRILSYYYTSWSANRNKKIEVGFYVILATTFLVVCFGPAINKGFAHGVATCTEYPMKAITKKKNVGKPYVYVIMKDRTERFKVSRDLYGKLDAADSAIILCIKKGALGYDYVEEFKLVR